VTWFEKLNAFREGNPESIERIETVDSTAIAVTVRKILGVTTRQRYKLQIVNNAWQVAAEENECPLCKGTGKARMIVCQICKGAGWMDPRRRSDIAI